MNTALRQRARLAASTAALTGALAWLPAGAAGQDLAALACLAVAALGGAVAWLLRGGTAAPPPRPESVDERWRRASEVLAEVALQAERVTVLASAELERNQAGAPHFAALAEQIRALARHSMDSAARVQRVDPHDLPRRRP